MRTPKHLFINTAVVVKNATQLDSGRAVINGPSGTEIIFKCRVQTGAGDKTAKLGGINPSYFGTIYCDPKLDVVEEDKIRFKNKIWNIVSIDSDEMNVLMNIVIRKEYNE